MLNEMIHHFGHASYIIILTEEINVFHAENLQDFPIGLMQQVAQIGFTGSHQKFLKIHWVQMHRVDLSNRDGFSSFILLIQCKNTLFRASHSSIVPVLEEKLTPTFTT